MTTDTRKLAERAGFTPSEAFMAEGSLDEFARLVREECAAAVALIYKLVAEHKGPDGFATWKDAALAERMKCAALQSRVEALEKAGQCMRVVAVVEESQLDQDPFAAKVRWLFNPVPEGAELFWLHPHAPQEAPMPAELGRGKP